jgi:hypothetical protein
MIDHEIVAKEHAEQTPQTNVGSLRKILIPDWAVLLGESHTAGDARALRRFCTAVHNCTLPYAVYKGNKPK